MALSFCLLGYLPLRPLRLCGETQEPGSYQGPPEEGFSPRRQARKGWTKPRKGLWYHWSGSDHRSDVFGENIYWRKKEIARCTRLVSVLLTLRIQENVWITREQAGFGQPAQRDPDPPGLRSSM
jgi:hypothetical protein